MLKKTQGFVVKTFIRFSTLLVGCTLLSIGCSSLQGSRAGAFWGSKKSKYLQVLEDGSLKTPCIHLPFIDKNFPELLGEVIRLHDPKVDPVGAYRISRMLVKREKKEKTHVIDTGSVKLCRLRDEMGYSFKAVKIKEN